MTIMTTSRLRDNDPAPRPVFPLPGSIAAAPRPARSGTRCPAPAARVVNLNNGTQIQVILVRPGALDQVSEIADNLRDKRRLSSTSSRRTRTSPAGWWTSSPAAPMRSTERSKKSPFLHISSRPTTWMIQGDLVEDLENNAKYLWCPSPKFTDRMELKTF